jgi:serine/threonine-protein kinase RsbT
MPSSTPERTVNVSDFSTMTLDIRTEADLVLARAQARNAAQRLGFRMVDQSRIATAVSELTRNVLRYATNGVGEVVIRTVDDPARRGGIEVVVTDQGPGIPDLDAVFREGFSSGRGLGLGLSGTRRLMDEMEIDSTPSGTRVTIRKWRR